MEGQKFDAFSKALARWVSRRRLLAGLFGGMAGALLGPSTGRAQTPQAAEGLARAARRSKEVMQRLPRAEDMASQGFDSRLSPFVEQVRALTGAVGRASGWNADQRQGYLTAMRLVPLAVSAGSDAYLDDWAANRIRALGGERCPPKPDRPRNAPPRPTTCTTECCTAWESCDAGCATGDDACAITCFLDFVECYVSPGADGNPCTPGSKCLPIVVYSCDGDCL